MSIFGLILIILWLIFWLYWAVSAFGTKKVLKRANSKARYFGIILVIAVILISQGMDFNAQLIPHNKAVLIAGTILCALGLAFAVWARRHLGKNWNIEPSIQQDHELVTSGPYRFVRHPIYTGLLIAFLGSALVGGLSWIIIFIFTAGLFIWRIHAEENFTDAVVSAGLSGI